MCSWARSFEPIAGWKAQETKFTSSHRGTPHAYSSWRVEECPEFIQDEEREDMIALEKEPWEKAVCERLQELYFSKGFSFERIGEVVGNAPATISKWMYGTLCPESSAKRVLERTEVLLEQQSKGRTV